MPLWIAGLMALSTQRNWIDLRYGLGGWPVHAEPGLAGVGDVVGGGEGELRVQAGACSWGAVQDELAAECLYAVFQAGQACAVVQAGAAGAVVADGDAQAVAGGLGFDGDG